MVSTQKLLRVYFGYEISFNYVNWAMEQLDTPTRELVNSQVIVSNPWEDFTHARLNELHAGSRRLHAYNKHEVSISEKFAVLDIIDWVKAKRKEHGDLAAHQGGTDIFARAETEFSLRLYGVTKVDGIVIADDVILCESKHNLNVSILKALEQSLKAVRTWRKLCDVVLNGDHDLSEDFKQQAEKDIKQLLVTEENAKKPLCIALAGYFITSSTVQLIDSEIQNVPKFSELRNVQLLFVEL
jgi:hypothetical protein